MSWHDKQFKDMRVLLCNDDGIDAPGMALLERVANRLFADVWVVAPLEEQSAKSRALTVRKPIAFDQRDERHFAVHGTPVDCIIVALNGLMLDHKPDLVMSGVNFGANLAEDVGYSGTIGCAFEAALDGYPAIAFSQCFLPGKAKDIPWHLAEGFIEPVVDFIKSQSVSGEEQADLVYNVNFPAIETEANTDLVWTQQGRRQNKQKVEIARNSKGGTLEIQMLRQAENPAENSDLATVIRGATSITRLSLDQCLSTRPKLV